MSGLKKRRYTKVKVRRHLKYTSLEIDSTTLESVRLVTFIHYDSLNYQYRLSSVTVAGEMSISLHAYCIWRIAKNEVRLYLVYKAQLNDMDLI